MASIILGIETSCAQCSVALQVDTEQSVLLETKARMHSKKLLGMVDQLLADAGIVNNQIDLLSFSCGPGSFTGLRIASGVVQGLAYAQDIPVAPISTLAVLAQEQSNQEGAYILACIDARLDEVYSGWYRIEQGLARGVIEDQVCTVQQLALPSSPVVSAYEAAGDGWAQHQQAITNQLSLAPGAVSTAEPHALQLLPLAELAQQQNQTVDAMQALPVYLRDEVHWKKLPGR